jgi:tetratricopeptide (TPR) repeat protein
VRQKSQLSELYNEARQLSQAGKWQAVINVFTKIEAIDPKFDDADNLLATAKDKVAALNHQEQLEALYDRAVREIDTQSWQTARQLLGQVIEMQPDYRQAERLLDRVETELSRQDADSQRQEKLRDLYAEAQKLADRSMVPAGSQMRDFDLTRT